MNYYEYLEHSPCATLVCNYQGEVLYNNLRACNLIDKFDEDDPLNGLINFSAVDFIPANNFKQLIEVISNKKEGQQFIVLPANHKREGLIETHFFFFTDEEIIITLVDVTEQHRVTTMLEYKELVADSVLSNISEAVVGFNRNGEIEFIGGSTERLFKISREEFFYEDVLSLFSDESKEEIKKIIEGEDYLAIRRVGNLFCSDSAGRKFPVSISHWRSSSDDLDLSFFGISDRCLSSMLSLF